MHDICMYVLMCSLHTVFSSSTRQIGHFLFKTWTTREPGHHKERPSLFKIQGSHDSLAHWSFFLYLRVCLRPKIWLQVESCRLPSLFVGDVRLLVWLCLPSVWVILFLIALAAPQPQDHGGQCALCGGSSTCILKTAERMQGMLTALGGRNKQQKCEEGSSSLTDVQEDVRLYNNNNADSKKGGRSKEIMATLAAQPS